MPRYAIYFAPRAETPLHRLASAWLGRDALRGLALARPEVDSLDAWRCAEITKSAARYGFHATLKAPFRLAAESSDSLVEECAREIARDCRRFTARLEVQTLGPFIALRPAVPVPQIGDLHETLLTGFEPHRAPLSEDEFERRKKVPLSPRHLELLEQYGYPYVLDEFHFHMTLTCALEEPERRLLLSWLRGYLKPALADETEFDSFSVFRQPDPKSPFVAVSRHWLA